MLSASFITWDELLDLHRTQLELYGGQDGFVDEGVVRSVMARPQFTAQYNSDADLAELAADYMYGLATTQGFSDGNKRASVVVAIVFLHKNGLDFIVTKKLLYLIAMAVARGEVTRDELADIFRDHITELDIPKE